MEGFSFLFITEIFGEPGVFKGLLSRNPLLWISDEHLFDQILHLIRELAPVDLAVFVLALHVVDQDAFCVRSLEERAASEHNVENDTGAEDVSLAVVAFIVQYLGSDVTWGATSQGKLLLGTLQLGRKTEVDDFDVV